MRNIQFQEVSMKNFGPYINPMTLSFPDNKLILMTGPNGIGKTMALDAIPFTLYGSTSKGARGDDVVNNRVEKNCKTWVKFKVNDNQYIITRYHKYTKLGNTVILNRNGEDIKKGHREVLPEIEKLICSQKAFMNTLMFGQKVKDFFTDLVDSDKKEIFRKLLGLEQYLSYYNQASNFLKELNKLKDNLRNKIEIDKGVYDDVNNQIDILSNLKLEFYKKQQEKIKNLHKSIEDNERLLNNWKKTLEQLKIKNEDITEIIKELSKVQNELSGFDKNYSAKIESLEKQKELKMLELNSEVDKNKAKITFDFSEQSKLVNNKINEINQIINDKNLSNQNTQHNIDLQINKLKSNQESLTNEIIEINNNILESNISSCPTCEQEISEDIKKKLIIKTENIQQTIEKKQDEINTLLSEKSKINNKLKIQLDLLYKEKDEAKSKLNIIVDSERDAKKEIDEKLDNLKIKVDLLVEQQKKKILDTKELEQKQLKEKEADLELRKTNQEKISEETNSVLNTITSLESEIKTSKSQLKNEKETEYDETQLNSYINKKQELENAIKNKEEETVGLEKSIILYDFWKAAFSSTGIPSMLIDDSIPFMNKKISKYLDLLTNGRYIVSFDTLDETKAGDYRDKISVHVIDTETGANSRIQLSGGQTRILDIATILTLGDLQTNIQDVKFNILLFDEIYDALDYDNAAYVSKVLNKLKIGKSIYVISHKHQDQLEPDEHLEF
jgi:DNA repair exonuclease SbcCD ATPase subunit